MTTRNRDYSRNEKVQESQPPSLIAYHVTERGGKSYWARLGVAWDHEDGKGLTVDLDLMPVNGGRIVLRVPPEDKGQAEERKGA